MKDFAFWIEARKPYRLSHGQVQMALELGMNPKKFGKFANYRQEPWKLPLPQFIEDSYRKRLGQRHRRPVAQGLQMEQSQDLNF